jgi:protein-disulfide isomerase
MAKQRRSPVKNEDFVLRVDGHPALGRPEAMLTLVEFSDLQCGSCRRHVNSILPVLVDRCVDTGRMRHVYFDFPVEARHPAAYGAAIAARCAADQNVVQPMRQCPRREMRGPCWKEGQNHPKVGAATRLRS